MINQSITDEMLSAFFDGVALPVESLIVNDNLKDSPDLQEMKDIIDDLRFLDIIPNTEKVEPIKNEGEQLGDTKDLKLNDIDNYKFL